MGKIAPDRRSAHVGEMTSKLVSPHFQSEQLLVSAFVAFIFKTKNNSIQLVQEFEAGFGRPDVLLYGAPIAQAASDVKSLAKLNPRLAPLLSTTVSKTVQSLSALALASGSSEVSARRIAGDLISIDRLKMNDNSNQTFTIRPILKPPFSQVVAIEAKLRDWRRALVQAYRYLQFSTESWVLLDSARAASAIKERALFESCGIGLASFSAIGELHIHVYAVNRKWEGGALAWRTQALLARTIDQF